MQTLTLRLLLARTPCYWRPILLISATVLLLSVFWFTSRYPQLLGKAAHVGQPVASMAYGSEILSVSPAAPVPLRILTVAINWLNSMKIGMTFGVLFGALLHTALRYYPLKIGSNLYLNSMKGALVGVPMGVCANCSVPVACGVTRGHGRIEVALGFLFSSPNFNPVVVVMTFIALPLSMSLIKYAVLALLIVAIVPAMIRWLERDKPLRAVSFDSQVILRPSTEHCDEAFSAVFKELARDYVRHVWMLAKPTIVLMAIASLAAAALLALVPWQTLLSEVTPLRLALVSLISVLMPVPIALDVMFAAQLANAGVASGYVMLFVMTLGTYSIIPSIYLWRDVSKRLAVLLFCFFALLGWALGMIFV